MNILICDDQIEYLEKVREVIRNWSREKRVKVKVASNLSAEEIIKAANFDKYHLAFLDIEMEEMSGIELAKKLKEINTDISIAFVTNYDSYVYEAFEIEVLQYIYKNNLTRQVPKVLDRVQKRWQEKQGMFYYSVRRTPCSIRFDEIYYMEVQGRKMYLHTEDETIEFSGRIKDVIKELPDDSFIQCYRSYIVNLNKIKKIQYNTITLDNGNTVPFSEKLRKELKEKQLLLYTR